MALVTHPLGAETADRGSRRGGVGVGPVGAGDFGAREEDLGLALGPEPALLDLPMGAVVAPADAIAAAGRRLIARDASHKCLGGQVSPGRGHEE